MPCINFFCPVLSCIVLYYACFIAVQKLQSKIKIYSVYVNTVSHISDLNQGCHHSCKFLYLRISLFSMLNTDYFGLPHILSCLYPLLLNFRPVFLYFFEKWLWGSSFLVPSVISFVSWKTNIVMNNFWFVKLLWIIYSSYSFFVEIYVKKKIISQIIGGGGLGPLAVTALWIFEPPF